MEGPGLDAKIGRGHFQIPITVHNHIMLPAQSNVTHQLLAYADDVNLLGDNIDTINKK
jgi:hypothetical protein